MIHFANTLGMPAPPFALKKMTLAIASHLVAVSALMVAPAFAEDVASTRLDAVVVTGEKIARPEDKTLTSVEVVTSDEMEVHGDKNLQDVLARTPGVYSQSGNENWGIRGVPVSGFDSQGAGTMNGAVTVFVDGAAQPHRSVTLNPSGLWDMEQVEVFRGAQSTIMGRNSLAGAIIMKTKDPTYAPAFAVQANAGKYGEKGASAMVNGALVENKVAARLSVDYQAADGYITNETLDEDARPLRSTTTRAKMLMQPTSRLDMLFTVSNTNKEEGTNAVSVVDGKPEYYSIYLNTAERDRTDQTDAIVQLDYQLSDNWMLTSLTTSTRFEYLSLLDYDQGVVRAREADRKHDQRLDGQEIRLSFEGDRVTGFLGVYYGIHQNDILDQINLKLDGVEDPALVVDGEVRNENSAVFGEINWEFIERWQLIAGLRYDKEKSEIKFDYDDPLGFATVPSADDNQSFDKLLPKLGVSHEFGSNQLIGLVWYKGYRGGGLDISTSTAHLPYDAETTDTYEASWRGAWLDRRLRSTANAFYTDWKDQQVEVADENGIGFVDNAAAANIMGLEASLQYQVTPGLELWVAASFTATEYDEFDYQYVDWNDDLLKTQDLSGQKFPFAPEYKVTVGGSYSFNNGLRISTDIIHQDDSVTLVVDDPGTLVERPNDSYTLVNLNADYPVMESLLLSAYVKNLTDKEYITNNQSNDETLDVGAPLTAGVAARYDF